MKRFLVLGSASAFVMAGFVVGCYAGTDSLASESAATSPAANDDAAASAGGGGLPCEVKALLEARCQGCHSATPSSAPMSLMTFEDVTAPAKSDPSKKVADLAIARMRDTVSPMPPSGNRVADADIAAFEAWVKKGSPREACAPPPPAPAAAGSTGEGAASASTACGSLDNPAWQKIYATYFGPGTPGHCANAGCHDKSNGGWSAGANPTASSMLTAWINRGLISTSNPSSSTLASPSSPLVWFNPGGSMPADSKAPNPQAVTDIKAWLAATPACTPDAGGSTGGGTAAKCPTGWVSIALSLEGDVDEYVESRPANLMVYGGGQASACFESGRAVDLKSTRDTIWTGAPCGVSDRCIFPATGPLTINASIE